MNSGETSYFKALKLGDFLSELPKSTLPASVASDNGAYQFFCSSSVVKYCNVYIQDKPTVLMGTGGIASVNFGTEKFSYSTDTWAFRSNDEEELKTEYIYRCLQHKLPKIDYLAFEGSGLKHLRKNDIKKLKLRVPANKLVTSKILSILRNVDTSIEKTESLIEKYKQIKVGLMHDLFTRGIGADGKLRPPRELAPELYQETPIGWIPKEWKYSNLYSLLAPVANNLRSGPFGSALLKAELSEDGIPFLGIDNIHTERFERNYRRFVSDQKFNSLIKYAVRPRDVVITIMGTVGRSAVIPSDIQKALSSKHLWTMTFDTNIVVPELLCWQLNYSPWVLYAFRKESQGGIMDAIQSKTLKNLLLPLPSLEEQELILGKYNAVTGRISSENELLIKLKVQKAGLMQDLLTGKVQVPINTSEAVHV